VGALLALAAREDLEKVAVSASAHDPLSLALARKAEQGGLGAVEGRTVATGDGWRVVDVVCTTGPRDRRFEERQASASISLVLSGTFVYRSRRGSSFMSPGALVLGNAGDVFECSHDHGEGDRCLSFQLEPELFERIARDAGAPGATFDRDRLPPLRTFAPLAARAAMALARDDPFEEIVVELAAAAIALACRARRAAPPPPAPDPARIAGVLSRLASRSGEPSSLAGLASAVGLSRHHFLRTFKAVTGVTPHQWLLRARLRRAAEQLALGRRPVTEIALDVGFDDLSNFIRTFRAEFGMSPSHYRRGSTVG
jgi:AraC-like DNA-binding protein